MMDRIAEMEPATVPPEPIGRRHTMPRSLKVLLGAATAVPIGLVGYLLVRILGVVVGTSNHGGSVQQGWLQDTLHELLTAQLTALGVLVALLGPYLWHLLVHRAHRRGGQVALWVLALLIAPIIAMPIYWLTNIWPEGELHQGRVRSA